MILLNSRTATYMRGKLRRPFREHYAVLTNTLSLRGCRVRDFMVVGFTTNRTISAYHRESCEFESR